MFEEKFDKCGGDAIMSMRRRASVDNETDVDKINMSGCLNQVDPTVEF